jgi:hypothetical protein
LNKTEAREILTTELTKYRNWSYEQLRALVDVPKRSFEVTGGSGTRYSIDIYADWDAQPNGDVRVFGCIDDGGWRAYLPMCDSFIKRAAEVGVLQPDEEPARQVDGDPRPSG